MTDFEIGMMLINKGNTTNGVQAYKQGRADAIDEVIDKVVEKLLEERTEILLSNDYESEIINYCLDNFDKAIEIVENFKN